MTNSTHVLKPDIIERFIHGLAIVLAGSGLICAGWFSHMFWTQNVLRERIAQLNTYEIELQQWAIQAANEEFDAKRQLLMNELYNQTCIIPAAVPIFGEERSGLLINGICYVPTNYGVDSQVRAQIPAPPTP